ncbi:AfsA-related hotdog domain-containing protein [Streptomyces sp. SLBN-31]|uniref:AfsA-related hotdog domain-containing protein n=1 Tax=Streptomyces sp. SLBN-31 TaxID=2768444 RepID=UPI0021B29E89|nr:AfsA-related hotdog domain-containing protein [Streptomyces sp. SLBN-31]
MSPTDVVLSPLGQPHRWQLRVDTRHPVLFDHIVDHVPGMLLIEAARQAATATLGHTTLPSPSPVSSCTTSNSTPPAPSRHTRPTAQAPTREAPEPSTSPPDQNEEDVFRCTLTMAPPLT